jgi:hypothetical protein
LICLLLRFALHVLETTTDGREVQWVHSPHPLALAARPIST